MEEINREDEAVVAYYCNILSSDKGCLLKLRDSQKSLNFFQRVEKDLIKDKSRREWFFGKKI